MLEEVVKKVELEPFEISEDFKWDELVVVRKPNPKSEADYLTVLSDNDNKELVFVMDRVDKNEKLVTPVHRNSALLMKYADHDSPDMNYRDTFVKNIMKCYDELEIVTEAWHEFGLIEFSTLMLRNEIPKYPDVTEQIERIKKRLYKSGGPTYDEVKTFDERQKDFHHKMKNSSNAKKVMLLYPMALLIKFIRNTIEFIKNKFEI